MTKYAVAVQMQGAESTLPSFIVNAAHAGEAMGKVHALIQGVWTMAARPEAAEYSVTMVSEDEDLFEFTQNGPI